MPAGAWWSAGSSGSSPSARSGSHRLRTSPRISTAWSRRAPTRSASRPCPTSRSPCHNQFVGCTKCGSLCTQPVDECRH
ncbi:hypothetical protein NS44R_14875 [Mammaliicoccus sciuri]|nr:hypothetical protein NS44R_14875 [Mammaliicoccus sciuri]